jgi:hypothetical protein
VNAAAPTAATQDAPAAPAVAGETVLLEDTFDSATLDSTKWPFAVFSGYQDMRVVVTSTGQALSIAPLIGADGISRYNGISSNPLDLSRGGYAQAQLVQGPVGVAAYAMFTAGSDAMNFYRIYQGGPAAARVILVEKRIAGVKIALANSAYDVATQQFLRIRHDYRPGSGVDDVVFEAAPAVDDTPVELYREPWDPAVAASGMVVEMKAGTSGPEPQPGVVVWDNVRAAAVSQQ